jgi:hypothetical protein
MTMIESRERRASFLAAVIRELELHECRILRQRAEDLDLAERHHDVVVMRCAGGLAEMLPVAAGLLSPGGLVVASGPPKQPIAHGTLDPHWIEVEGPSGGRLFALYRKADVTKPT